MVGMIWVHCLSSPSNITCLFVFTFKYLHVYLSSPPNIYIRIKIRNIKSVFSNLFKYIQSNVELYIQMLKVGHDNLQCLPISQSVGTTLNIFASA